MQLAQPTCVADVRLPTWDVLGVAGVDQYNLEAMLFEYLVGWDPIHARELHRDAGHTVRFEPIGQIMQIMRESSKRTHGCICHVRVHCSHVFTRTDINSGSANVDGLNGRGPFGLLLLRISKLPDSDFAKSRTAISVIPGQFGHG